MSFQLRHSVSLRQLYPVLPLIGNHRCRFPVRRTRNFLLPSCTNSTPHVFAFSFCNVSSCILISSRFACIRPPRYQSVPPLAVNRRRLSPATSCPYSLPALTRPSCAASSPLHPFPRFSSDSSVDVVNRAIASLIFVSFEVTALLTDFSAC